MRRIVIVVAVWAALDVAVLMLGRCVARNRERREIELQRAQRRREQSTVDRVFPLDAESKPSGMWPPPGMFQPGTIRPWTN